MKTDSAVSCRCGHTLKEHARDDGKCLAPGSILGLCPCVRPTTEDAR
jgi:hypothetical protein